MLRIHCQKVSHIFDLEGQLGSVLSMRDCLIFVIAVVGLELRFSSHYNKALFVQNRLELMNDSHSTWKNALVNKYMKNSFLNTSANPGKFSVKPTYAWIILNLVINLLLSLQIFGKIFGKMQDRKKLTCLKILNNIISTKAFLKRIVSIG